MPEPIVLKIITDSTDAVTGFVDVKKASELLRAELERLNKELKGLSQYQPAEKSDLQKQYKDVEKALTDLQKPLDNTTKKQEELNESQQDGSKASGALGKNLVTLAKKAGLVAAAIGVVIGIGKAMIKMFKDTAVGMGVVTKATIIWNQAMYNLANPAKKQFTNIKELISLADRTNAQREKERINIIKVAKLQNEYNDLLVQASDNRKTDLQQAELYAKAEAKDQERRSVEITQLKENLSLLQDEIKMKPKLISLKVLEAQITAQIIGLEGENRRVVSQKTAKEEADYQKNLATYLEWIDSVNDARDDAAKRQKKIEEDALDESMQIQQDVADYLTELNEDYWDRKEKAAEEAWDFEMEMAKIKNEAAKKEAKDLWDIILKNEKLQLEANEDLVKSKEETWNSVSDVGYNFMSLLDEIMQKEIERAESNRSILDDRIRETENALQLEQDLMIEGYANNVDAKKKELDELNKQRQQALIEEEAAVKKANKIAIASTIADSLLAIARIIMETAKANAAAAIYLANPLTAAIGAAIIARNKISAALGIASIIAATAAASATKLAEGGSGSETGIVTGKSHGQGGERFLDHVEVERGETWGVLSRPASSKYGEVFHDMVSSFNKDQMPSFMPATNLVSVENSGPNSRLDKVNGSINKLNDSILRQSHISQIGNKKVIRTGNKVRIIG